MADINTQPFLFTASGLLSAATGPNGVAFPTAPSTAGGLPSGEPALKKKIRIQGIKVLKIGASGSAEIFDSATATGNANDSIYETDANDVATNLGINIKAGDVFVKITGGFKVWLYIDINA